MLARAGQCAHLRGPTGELRDRVTVPGERVELETCSLHGTCTRYAQIPAVHCCRWCKDNTAPVTRAAPAPSSGHCRHLGGPTGETRSCPSCGGRVELKVLVCAVHGRCTVGRQVDALACCATCLDYAAGPADALPGYREAGRSVGRRHLVYHILPVAGNGVWRRGVDQLRLRWGLFTGRKVVAVMTGPAGIHWLDSPDEVRAYLPADAEVIELPNNPALREVISWVPLWDRVLDGADPADAICYAHAKGVTRNVDPGNSCQWWASLLYSLTLDHWPLVEEHLRRHPITGPFKKVGRGFVGSRSAWHYSGSFWWARAGEFARREWRAVDHLWWGNESYPGLAYRVDEAGCLFHEGTVPTLDLYSPGYWDGTVRPEYAKWIRANPPAWPWIAVSTAVATQ